MSIFHNINARRKFGEIVELIQACLRPLNVNDKPAFSMMEMLVVMLVVSVVMAMHAPTVVKKKLETDRVTYEVWTPVTDGGDVAWNIAGKQISAIIGGEKAKIDEMLAESNKKPGMIISSPDRNDDDTVFSQIGVLRVDGETAYSGSVRLNKGVPLNDKSTSTIAIGKNIVALANNSIALGSEIKEAASANTVMIGPSITMKGLGNDGKTLTANNVSIGYGTYIKASDSIAIGKGLPVGDTEQVQDYDGQHGWKGTRISNANKSIVIGNSKVFAGEGTIAIGENVRVHPGSSKGNIVALGSNIGVLSSDASVNIGDSVETANKSVAIGYKAKGRGIESVAIGDSANIISVAIAERGGSSADYTVGIGPNVKAESIATHSVLIGNNAKSGSANSVVAIGPSAKASGLNAISIGYGANASVVDSIALGHSAQVSQANAISVFGKVTTADGIAIGYGVSDVNNTNSFAIGSDAKVTVADTFAIGSSASATASSAIPIGYGVSVANVNAIGIGYQAAPSANYAVIIGNQARGRGIALGSNASAASTVAVAIGRDSIADTSETVAIGYGAEAHDAGSVAIGRGANASSKGVAVGRGATGSSAGVAVGSSTTAYGGIAIGDTGTTSHGATGIYNYDGWTYVGTSSHNIYGITAEQIRNLARSGNLSVDIVHTNNLDSTYNFTSSNLYLQVTSYWYEIIKKEHKVETEHSREVEKTREVASGTGAMVNFEVSDESFAEYMDPDPGRNGSGGGGGGGTSGGSSGGKSGLTTPTPAPDSPATVPSGGSDSPSEPQYETYIDTETWVTTETFQRAYYEYHSYASDSRLKNITGENTAGMKEVNKLKVYDYKYKSEPKTPHVGVMAQHLKKIFPNAVVKDIRGYLKIRQEEMFFAMVNALKELDAKIKKIAIDVAQNIKIVTSNEAKIKARDVEIQELKEEIAVIRKAIERLPQK